MISGWDMVLEWVGTAKHEVRILPVEKEAGERELRSLHVTTKSVVGAVVKHSGGILIDGGWLRILGAGSEELRRSISSWNQERLANAWLIADDAVGGFFAVNGGAFEGKAGDIYYWAPDTLEWESLEMPYSEFVNWALSGDLQRFYETFRWNGWREQIQELHGDQGILIYPYLWAEGEELEQRTRRAVPIEELWHLNLDNKAQLGL